MSGLQTGLNAFTVQDITSQGTVLGSASDTWTYERIATTLTSSATNNSAVYGQQVTLTATVGPVHSIGVAPTGEVDFYDGTTKIGSGMLANGQNTVSIVVSLPAGSNDITATYDGDSNDSPTTSAQYVLTVTPALLTITASAESKTYGQTLTFGSGSTLFTSSGLQNGETIGSVTLAVTNNGGAGTAAVGSYTITPSAATGGTFAASNYSITYNTGTLMVTPALLTIAASAQSKTYGQTLTFGSGSTQFTSAGLQNGETIGSVTLAVTNNGGAATAAVGSYTITPSAATGGTFTATNYSITYDTGTLAVNQALLTVTASAESKTYGQTLTFGSGSTQFTSAGLQNGETIGSVTLAVSNNGGAATAAVGSYTITPSAATGGTFTASNYSITYNTGTLTVNPAAPVASIYVLDPTAGGALTLSGNAKLSIGGNLVVDSSSTTAILASGSSVVSAASVQVVGGVSKSGTASVVKTGTPTATGNPLANLAEPALPSYTGTPVKENVSGSTTATISQGIYSQITVSGSAQLTLNAGVYVIAGGGVTVSGSAVLNASGVTFIIEGGGFNQSSSSKVNGAGATIFNAGSSYQGPGTTGGSYGPITLTGNGTLSAPSSGTYTGILIFQPSDNTQTITLSGSAILGLTGTIDAPGAPLVESGSAQIGSSSNPVSIIVDRMTLSLSAIADGLSLAAPAGTTAYTPAQIRSAYGVNSLSEDGTGQTIAIVDAYNDPEIDLALDTFDSQFGLTSSGPSLDRQYGPASSFLTVLNQSGQSTSLPATDPSGPGTDNWEVEERSTSNGRMPSPRGRRSSSSRRTASRCPTSWPPWAPPRPNPASRSSR